MPKPISFGSINLGMPAGDALEISDAPFRVLILGDFSGRADRKLSPNLAGRKPIFVDRDNIDQVMAKLGVEISLPVGDGPERVALQFKELDDFHPDRLYQKLGVFAALRDLRARLGNSATFAEAAAQMRGFGSAREPAKAEPQARPAAVNTGHLLDDMLGAAPQAPETPVESGQKYLESLLQRAVAPHLVPNIDYTKQAELIRLVDESAAAQMRRILHHVDFQAVEAAWRGLFFLVRRLDTDAKLKLFFMDVARDELAADLLADGDLGQTATYRLLVEQTVGTPGGLPWAIVVGNYRFDQSRADVELLGRMAKIAAAAGAPFVAGGRERIFGCDSLAKTAEPRDWKPDADAQGNEAWAALRGLAEADYLGLVVPRLLLRMPYGKEGEPAEQFHFEEAAGSTDHERFLWGQGSWAVALLLAESYSRYGWDFEPGLVREITGLPLFVHDHDGEREVLPCAEVLLIDRALDPIADTGLMPLQSIKNQDAVSLASFRSLAASGETLAGRWAS
jgi:type VI secretion system protein ImpC